MVEILWRAQRLRSTIVFVNLPFGFLCIFFFSFGHVLLLPQHFSLFDLLYGMVALFIKLGVKPFSARNNTRILKIKTREKKILKSYAVV